MQTRDGATVRALDVRMIVDNEGDTQPWTIDTRELMIDVPGAGQARPMFVRSDFQPLPLITVDSRQRRTLDQFYPLPANERSEGRLPQFDVLWSVETPERTVASRTHVRRIETETTPYYAGYEAAPYYAYGWGPYWWYDPFFPVYGADFGFFAGPRFAGRGFRGGGFRGGAGGFRGGGGGFHGGAGGHGGGGGHR